jgi:hypothetical protein
MDTIVLEQSMVAYRRNRLADGQSRSSAVLECVARQRLQLQPDPGVQNFQAECLVV